MSTGSKANIASLRVGCSVRVEQDAYRVLYPSSMAISFVVGRVVRVFDVDAPAADATRHLTIGGRWIDMARIRAVFDIAEHPSENSRRLVVRAIVNADDLYAGAHLPDVARHVAVYELRQPVERQRRAIL